MATIAENLVSINNIITAIDTAIKARIGVGGKDITKYAGLIEKIPVMDATQELKCYLRVLSGGVDGVENGEENEVIVPEGVSTIAQYALQYLNVAKLKCWGVTSLGGNALNGISNNTYIEFYKSLSSAGSPIPSYNENRVVEYPDIASVCINNIAYNKARSSVSAGKLYINGVFVGTNLSIQDELITGIGNNAFNGAVWLEKIRIGDLIRGLSYYCFCGCTTLTEAWIGSGISLIQAGSFDGDSNLKDVYIKASIPPSLGSITVNGVTTWGLPDSVARVHVPAAAISDYQQETSWRSAGFENKFVALEEDDYEGFVADAEHQAKSIYESIAILTTAKENIKSALVNKGVDIGNRFADYPAAVSNLVVGGYNDSYKEYFLRTTGNIIIPNTCTTLRSYCFQYYTALKSLNIPASVISISSRLLYYSPNVTTLTVDSNNYVYTSRGSNDSECNLIIRKSDNIAICGCKSSYIPSGVLEITGYCFAGQTGITQLELPSTLVRFRNDCIVGMSISTRFIWQDINHILSAKFYNSNNSSTDTVSHLGRAGTNPISVSGKILVKANNANGYEEIKDVVIPNGTTEIPANTFAWATRMESIVIPEGVTYIGAAAFTNCSGLTEISIPSTVTSIGRYAFFFASGNPTHITKQRYASIESMLNINYVGEYAHPMGYLYIGNSDTPETNIVIPTSITIINAYAIYRISGLNKITINHNITSISGNGIVNWSILDFGSNPNRNIPNLLANGLGTYNANKTIIVPDDLYDTWKSQSNWRTYADNFVKYSEYYTP